MKVFKECCKNCLFSKDRIVSPKRMKEIVNKCVREQSYFICHKASINNDDAMCKNFYDSFGHYSQLLRIVERLGVVEFIDQKDSERLPSYDDMNKKSIKT